MGMTGDIERALRTGAGREEDAALAASAFARRALDEGLADVTYARAESPVGTLLLARTDRGLVRLAYADDVSTQDAVLARLAARVSPRILEAPDRLDAVRRQLEEYFEGRRRSFALELDWMLMGPFARRVLDRTSAIPYGGRATYAQVAADAGSPRASRAAGNALGANPLPIVCPCHRVVATGGGLGGYTGGLDRKLALLAIEERVATS